MNHLFSEIPEKQLAKGISGRYIHTENNTVGLITIEKGAVLPAHAHFHEQITQVISGKLEMTIDGNTLVLEPDSITVIPSNAVHSAVALTDCAVIDTFHPVREDYK